MKQLEEVAASILEFIELKSAEPEA
jgi:hypothetical protein